ncbi:hypothetical protein LSAT2_028164 [Lamellibrachia satsuma]|nr:hypothetical protein LSAT2_028164 [Lamellibrachia satsuma]
MAYLSDNCNTLDVVFVVDSSGSINKNDDQNWGRVLAFINRVIDGFKIGVNDVHVGLIKYSNTAEVMFGLDKYIEAVPLKAIASQASEVMLVTDFNKLDTILTPLLSKACVTSAPQQSMVQLEPPELLVHVETLGDRDHPGNPFGDRLEQRDPKAALDEMDQKEQLVRGESRDHVASRGRLAHLGMLEREDPWDSGEKEERLDRLEAQDLLAPRDLKEVLEPLDPWVHEDQEGMLAQRDLLVLLAVLGPQDLLG